MSEALKACSHMHDQFYIITHKHTLSDHYQWFIQTVLQIYKPLVLQYNTDWQKYDRLHSPVQL